LMSLLFCFTIHGHSMRTMNLAASPLGSRTSDPVARRRLRCGTQPHRIMTARYHPLVPQGRTR
jgi:hypothetical protein